MFFSFSVSYPRFASRREIVLGTDTDKRINSRKDAKTQRGEDASRETHGIDLDDSKTYCRCAARMGLTPDIDTFSVSGEDVHGRAR